MVHRIDAWSPLEPPVGRSGRTIGSGGTDNNVESVAAGDCAQPHDPSVAYRFPDLPLRACDLECGAREAKGPLAGCGQADWGQTGGALEGQWRNSGAVPAGGAILEQNQAASSTPASGSGTITNAAALVGTSSEGSGVETKCTFAGVSMAKRQAVQDWLLASGTEVLAMLEGQENMQGNVVQVHFLISREFLVFLSRFRNFLYL